MMIQENLVRFFSVLIAGAMIIGSEAPLFAFSWLDAPVWSGIHGGNSTIRAFDSNGSVVASWRSPARSIRLDLPNIVAPAFGPTMKGFLFNSRTFFNILRYDNQQTLQPNDIGYDYSSERQFGAPGTGFETTVTLSFYYATDHYKVYITSNNKYWEAFNNSSDPNTFYLTNAPNRSAACANAVNDSLANPNASTDGIKTNCQSLLYLSGRFRHEIIVGVDWPIGSQWKAAFNVVMPSKYNVDGYTIAEEPKVEIALYWGRY